MGCKFAAANTKAHSKEIAKYLEENIELDTPLNIHVTGCHNSCAQHYIGDIGLRGAPCKVDGETVEGYHVVLGGGVDDNGAIAQDVFESVPMSEMPDLILNMLKVYQEKRDGEEDFASFTRKHNSDELKEMFAIS